jgi:hypothetical protein
MLDRLVKQGIEPKINDDGIGKGDGGGGGGDKKDDDNESSD